MSEDLNRVVQERMNKHAAVGVSERQIAKALNEDFANGNIGAIDATSRAEDEAFYEDLPMHGAESDPTNQKGDVEKKASIIAALQNNSEIANQARAKARNHPDGHPGS